MTIVYALIMFCILIFIHELGHFIAAKACGIKVNEFAIGMGPALFSKTKGETKYSVRLLPIGGYCAMEGESDNSEDDRAFANKPAWKRAITLVAGSFMNLVLAIVLMMVIGFYLGTPSTTIDSFVKGSEAKKAGLMQGDKIVSIDGTNIKNWEDVSGVVGKIDDGNAEIVVKRDGQDIKITTPVFEKDGQTMIGIAPKMEKSIIKAVGFGFTGTWEMTKSMYTIIKQLFTGEVSTKELSGPVGIVYIVNQSVNMGFIYLVYLMAIISLNLAIFNMLPFPALDGGRLLFLGIQKITGKAITPEMENKVHTVGMVLLLGLMVYVTWNDIVRFIVPLFK